MSDLKKRRKRKRKIAGQLTLQSILFMTQSHHIQKGFLKEYLESAQMDVSQLTNDLSSRELLNHINSILAVKEF